MRAYILLNIKPQHTAALMKNLKDEESIISAGLVHGPYDGILEVKDKNLEGINKLVLRIRAMKGIVETVTCLVVQSWSHTDK
nr:Lrp/AsnC ligand binding domain-containing protein [Anaerolineae bacterium]